MSQARSIAHVLANLVLQRNVPLKAVAIAGEAIAADAKALSHPEGPKSPKTGEELYQFLETYDALSRRCEGIVSAYMETRDADALLRDLSEIKRALVDLY
jgi:hypothetical protein